MCSLLVLCVITFLNFADINMEGHAASDASVTNLLCVDECIPKEPRVRIKDMQYNRFHTVDLTAKMMVGPLSRRFMRAQMLWAEVKLWAVFDKISSPNFSFVENANLATFEVRLALSWFIGTTCMDVHPDYVLRKIRNEFLVKKRRSHKETVRYAVTLFEMCHARP